MQMKHYLTQLTEELQDESDITVLGVAKEVGAIRVAIAEGDEDAKQNVDDKALNYQFKVATEGSADGHTILQLIDDREELEF